jgi:hypothetical protein
MWISVGKCRLYGIRCVDNLLPHLARINEEKSVSAGPKGVRAYKRDSLLSAPWGTESAFADGWEGYAQPLWP